VPVGFDVVSNCYLRDVSVRIKGCWLALSDGVEGTGEWKGKETLLEEFAIRAFERWVGGRHGMARGGSTGILHDVVHAYIADSILRSRIENRESGDWPWRSCEVLSVACCGGQSRAKVKLVIVVCR